MYLLQPCNMHIKDCAKAPLREQRKLQNIMRNFRKATYWIFNRNLSFFIPDLIPKEKTICQVIKKEAEKATELPS